MNTPQYQQQMQSLAMQVRQQEDGIKRTKKFLKAYEDIQLAQPMPQQQPAFMQPPGGQVAAMNNNLAAQPAQEEQAMSFTQMAGGMGGGEMMGPEGDAGVEGEAGPEGQPGPGPRGRPEKDAQGRYYDTGMTLSPGASMNPYVTDAERTAQQQSDTANAEYEKRMGIDKQKRKLAVETRNKFEDDVPLEQRGSKTAQDADVQRARAASDKLIGRAQKSTAANNAELGSLNLKEEISKMTDRLKDLARIVKKGTTTSIETDPSTGKTYPIPGYSQQSIDQAKSTIKEIEGKLDNAKKMLAHSEAKRQKIAASRPNRALGLGATIGGSLMATANAMASGGDPEIDIGRWILAEGVGKRKKLTEEEAMAVRKVLDLEYEGELPGQGRAPRSSGLEPIDYSTTERMMMNK